MKTEGVINMSQIPPKTKCPSKEELTAYFDNEFESNGSVETHLKSCAQCKAYIDSIAKIDSMIKQEVENEDDHQLAMRIKTRVNETLHKENMRNSHPFRRFALIWRIVVLLAIGCGIIYLLWKESQQKEQNDADKVIQNSAHVPASFSPVQKKSESTKNHKSENPVSE